MVKQDKHVCDAPGRIWLRFLQKVGTDVRINFPKDYIYVIFLIKSWGSRKIENLVFLGNGKTDFVEQKICYGSQI